MLPSKRVWISQRLPPPVRQRQQQHQPQGYDNRLGTPPKQQRQQGTRRAQKIFDEELGPGLHVYDDLMAEKPNVPHIVRFRRPHNSAARRGFLGSQQGGMNTQVDHQQQQLATKIEEKEEQNTSVPNCEIVRLDFSKTDTGRDLSGGDYVKDEWYHKHGVYLWAEASKEQKVEEDDYDDHGDEEEEDDKPKSKNNKLHPMIFDSGRVEQNSLGPLKDVYQLGSPNLDCGGPGVGGGGKLFSEGSNCEDLGAMC